MTLPLAGRRIVVTRPSAQAKGLLAQIRAAGGEALACPTLEILPLEDAAPFAAVAAKLEQFDIAIFVSRNAVREALKLLGARRFSPRTTLATVGAGSRAELDAAGLRNVLAPPGRPDSEALLELAPLRDVAGK